MRAVQQQRSGVLGYVFYSGKQEKQPLFYAAIDED
jgi:hypothetical protein